MQHIPRHVGMEKAGGDEEGSVVIFSELADGSVGQFRVVHALISSRTLGLPDAACDSHRGERTQSRIRKAKNRVMVVGFKWERVIG